MDNQNLKILFKNYKKWVGVPAVLVFSIIIFIGLVQEIEKNKIIFEQLNQIQYITFDPHHLILGVGVDKNGDGEKPAHRSLNTDYIKVVVAFPANVAPTAGTVTLDKGTAITVTGNSSTTVSGTTTVTDTDGWDDISSATSTLFLNQTSTCSSASTDPNWCYYISSCSLGATTSESRIVTCSADVWFLAEPTTPTTSYSGKQWQMDITAKDAAGESDTGTTSQDLYTLYYFDITGSIDYGTMNPGATSSESTTTVTNQGNYQIDLELEGDPMETVDGVNSIIADQQHYSGSSLGDWGGTALTSTAANIDLSLAKPTATTTPPSDDIYWMIKIPDTQASGTYSGTNTVSAIDEI